MKKIYISFGILMSVLITSFLIYTYLYLPNGSCIQVIVSATNRITGKTKVFGSPCVVPFWYKDVYDYNPGQINSKVDKQNNADIQSSASATTTVKASENEGGIFIDPELRYKLLIPMGMVYQYDKESKSLNIWSKKDRNEQVQFSVSYRTLEEQKDFQPLTEQEKNRTVTLKTKESVSIYDPHITEACHEEGSVPLKDGALHFYNVCGNNELRPLLDKIISNTEILK